MSILTTHSVGIEITRDELRLATVRHGKEPFLDGYQTVPLPPDTLRPSHREPNILDPGKFAAQLTSGHLKLLTKTKRVALSLPDSIGRVMLLDLDTRFKNRDEGADIIRWKLKKNLSLDTQDLYIDYQVLAERESGEVAVLAGMIARPVVTQYEELFLSVGMEPVKIDFTTFNLYRFFAKRLDLAENAAFIALYGNVISILIFCDGILEFYRTKELGERSSEPNRIFQEISSSLLIYRNKQPGRAVQELFCVGDPERGEELAAMAGEAASLEPVTLDPCRFIACRDGLSADRSTLFTLAASMGAAIRNP